jgi:hypothetical protein
LESVHGVMLGHSPSWSLCSLGSRRLVAVGKSYQQTYNENSPPLRLLFIHLYGLHLHAGNTFTVKIELLDNSNAEINDPFS